MSTDVETIRSIIESVGANWDKHAFHLSKEHFADTVEIDYRSLGAPAVTQDTPDTLEGNWKAVLLGFDRTEHLIDNFAIELTTGEDGVERAVSQSYVLAYHLIRGAEEGESWTLMGRYEHALERRDGGAWKITKMALNVEQ